MDTLPWSPFPVYDSQQQQQQGIGGYSSESPCTPYVPSYWSGHHSVDSGRGGLDGQGICASGGSSASSCPGDRIAAFRVCGERVEVPAAPRRCQHSLLATLIGSRTAVPIRRNADGEIPVSSASSAAAFRLLAEFVTSDAAQTPKVLEQFGAALLGEDPNVHITLSALRLDAEYFLGSTTDDTDFADFTQSLQQLAARSGVSPGMLLCPSGMSWCSHRGVRPDVSKLHPQTVATPFRANGKPVLSPPYTAPPAASVSQPLVTPPQLPVRAMMHRRALGERTAPSFAQPAAGGGGGFQVPPPAVLRRLPPPSSRQPDVSPPPRDPGDLRSFSPASSPGVGLAVVHHHAEESPGASVSPPLASPVVGGRAVVAAAPQPAASFGQVTSPAAGLVLTAVTPVPAQSPPSANMIRRLSFEAVPPSQRPGTNAAALLQP